MSNEKKFLRLDVWSSGGTSREPDPDDEWDNGDSYTTWDVAGVVLEKHDSAYALPPDFPVEVGDTVYVVYAIYSTGCTFGSESGACLEVISFHKNKALAEKNCAALNDAGELIIEFDSGASVSRYRPWDGYFESLDSANLGEFTVKAP